MICVTIAQVSHRLALVDMLNAGGQCDLIEVRLDRFEKPPVITSLMECCPVPMIISCRRKEEGGDWSGNESARLALLRQAVLDRPTYVEIELDCAGDVRRYGSSKRVIAYTNTTEVPSDIEDIYRQACSMDPDVVKISVPARTPEEVWPIIKIIAKGKVPTVVCGWGRGGIMLNILGRRYKSPWSYAALERGMETYPGMATIRELREVYDYDQIDSRTPLVAVAGAPEHQSAFSRLLNHGFRIARQKTRSLPLEIGNIDLFGKIARAIQLEGVFVDHRHGESILRQASQVDVSAEAAKASDFVAIEGEQWRAFHLLSGAIAHSLDAALRSRHASDAGLSGRSVLVIGTSSVARGVCGGVTRLGGSVVTADRDNDAARLLASEYGGRFVAATQVYSTYCDAVVLCPSDSDTRAGSTGVDNVKPLAREGIVAADLTNLPHNTPFLEEVTFLKGQVVRPVDLLLANAQSALSILTKSTPAVDQLATILADIDLD